MQATDALLEFWYEGVDAAGVPGPDCFSRWFRGGPGFDAEIVERFGPEIETSLAGGCEDWSRTARGNHALVLLLDQLPRNAFRGQARAFSGDARALRLADDAVERGEHLELRPIERYFLYLPFEHAEDPIEQARAVRLYDELVEHAPVDATPFFKEAIDWARRHQVVIERFGRFPSRNAALGRVSTPDELAFLEETPGGF